MRHIATWAFQATPQPQVATRERKRRDDGAKDGSRRDSSVIAPRWLSRAGGIAHRAAMRQARCAAIGRAAEEFPEMKRVLAIALGLALLAPLAARAGERTLTISVYGFAQDAYKKLVYDPFEAKCGCKLVVETGNSVERLAKMEANKANPVVDMAVVSMADGLEAARKGLVDKIDVAQARQLFQALRHRQGPERRRHERRLHLLCDLDRLSRRQGSDRVLGRSPLAQTRRPCRDRQHHHQSGPADALHARPRARQGHARPRRRDRRDRRAQAATSSPSTSAPRRSCN